MKALSLDLILTSASTRADGSLGLRFSTAELQPSEKTVVFELLNQHLKGILQPTNGEVEQLVEVKAPLDMPSPSTRLRSVLFVEWKQKQPDESFESYYPRRMDQIIERIKSNLAPEP